MSNNGINASLQDVADSGTWIGPRVYDLRAHNTATLLKLNKYGSDQCLDGRPAGKSVCTALSSIKEKWNVNKLTAPKLLKGHQIILNVKDNLVSSTKTGSSCSKHHRLVSHRLAHILIYRYTCIYSSICAINPWTLWYTRILHFCYRNLYWQNNMALFSPCNTDLHTPICLLQSYCNEKEEVLESFSGNYRVDAVCD